MVSQMVTSYISLVQYPNETVDTGTVLGTRPLNWTTDFAQFPRVFMCIQFCVCAHNSVQLDPWNYQHYQSTELQISSCTSSYTPLRYLASLSPGHS